MVKNQQLKNSDVKAIVQNNYGRDGLWYKKTQKTIIDIRRKLDEVRC